MNNQHQTIITYIVTNYTDTNRSNSIKQMRLHNFLIVIKQETDYLDNISVIKASDVDSNKIGLMVEDLKSLLDPLIGSDIKCITKTTFGGEERIEYHSLHSMVSLPDHIQKEIDSSLQTYCELPLSNLIVEVQREYQ